MGLGVSSVLYSCAGVSRGGEGTESYYLSSGRDMIFVIGIIQQGAAVPSTGDLSLFSLYH